MTSQRARRFRFWLLAGSVLGSACTARAPVLSIEPAGMAPTLSAGRLRFGDTDLMRSIDVLGYSESQTASGLLQAGVKLRSRSGRVERFEWKVVWIDSTGFQLQGDDRSWTPLQVEPLGQCDLQATAPRPEATTFRFEVRRERPLAAD